MNTRQKLGGKQMRLLHTGWSLWMSFVSWWDSTVKDDSAAAAAAAVVLCNQQMEEWGDGLRGVTKNENCTVGDCGLYSRHNSPNANQFPNLFSYPQAVTVNS